MESKQPLQKSKQAFEIVSGSFTGQAKIETRGVGQPGAFGVLATARHAGKFESISFSSPPAEYGPHDIVRMKEIRNETTHSFIGSATAGIIGGGLFGFVGSAVAGPMGGALFGGVGLLAGVLTGGRGKLSLIGVEFRDGKKAVVQANPNDRFFRCFLSYAQENRLLDIEF